MAVNEKFHTLNGLDYVLLNNIEDEAIYIGPDKTIKWLNNAAAKIIEINKDNACFSTLCARHNPCDECLLSGSTIGLCEKNFNEKTEKIVAHYSVGDAYSDGVLLVFGDKSKYSNGIRSDVQIIEDHEKLFHEANHDQLTSLYNRRYMDYIFKHMDNDKRSEKLDNRNSITLIDIDKFKQINDKYGHAVGDEVLKVIAYRITSETRKADTAIRIGGDEFLIVHIQHSAYDILAFIKRLVQHINQPIHLDDGRILKVSVSIGILLDAQNHHGLANAMKFADHALYEAKALSPEISNYVFFGKDLEKEISNNQIIAETLDKAINQNDLSVYYQPIVSLKTNKICGMEALVRWLSESGSKMYSPKQFLPIAEKRSTIIQIGQLLLNEVIDDIGKYSKYIKNYDFVSINFSTRQLMSEQYVDFINNLLCHMEMDYNNLHIEIAEESLLQNVKLTKKIVESLRSAGVDIILDNFGKGYASLSYLLEYNIKKIKIDKHIISDIDKNLRHRKLVETLVSVADIYNIEVIAKGVETKAHYDIVKELGCHYAQGYYICRPQSIEKYVKFAREYYMKINQLTLLMSNTSPEKK